MSGQLCIQNPSLEGSPISGVQWFADYAWDANNAWDNCHTANLDRTLATPRLVAAVSTQTNSMPFPAPTDGSSYLYLESDSMQHQYVSQSLCEPLLAGTAYSLTIDLASAPTDANAAALGSAQLEIYGSTEPCRRAELLWQSPPLSRTWQTLCVTLRPTHEASALVLSPLGPMGKAAALVDHLVPVASCP
jgi:hypothetical protein